MSECDGHSYVHGEGGFCCTKCGHIREFKRRRASKKPAILALLSLAAIGGFLLVQYGNIDSNTIERQTLAVIGDIEGDVSGMIENSKVAETIGNSSVWMAIENSGLPPIRIESGFDPRLVENHIYEFTNMERDSHNVGPLLRDSRIDAIARGHSEDMSARNYYSHDSPEGHGPSDRGKKAGYDCRKYYGGYYTEGLTENIAMYATYTSYMSKALKTSYSWYDSEEDMARAIVDGWMNSPGHRESILEQDYTRIGIGVAINEDEDGYHTQNFC